MALTCMESRHADALDPNDPKSLLYRLASFPLSFLVELDELWERSVASIAYAEPSVPIASPYVQLCLRLIGRSPWRLRTLNRTVPNVVRGVPFPVLGIDVDVAALQK